MWGSFIRLVLICSAMGFSFGLAGCAADPTLIKAVYRDGLQGVKGQVEAGADINQRDSRGYTALMTASYYNLFPTAEYLLEKGADVNAQGNDGCTALMLAVVNQNVRMIKLLLQYNPDIALVDAKGKTALEYAKDMKLRMISGLLEAHRN